MIGKLRARGTIPGILLIIMLALSATGGAAQEQDLTAVPAHPTSATNLNVDGKAPMAAQGLDVEELEAVSLIVTFDETVSDQELEKASSGQVVHRFNKIFNGASIVVSGDQVDTIVAMEGVTAVYLDELAQLDTEVSPGFIGAPTLWNQLGGQGSAGEGVVVGVLDTGVWPEHPSFSDPDPNGNPYPAPPVQPGANGFGSGGPRSTCDFGNTATNPNDVPFTCNNKLIGAYTFLDTYKAVIGLLPTEYDSARDDNGHGTHTASTAAGNGNVAASIFGIPRGIVSGIAPRAHVIAYRVCGDQGCYQSDSMAAVEQAILDEVDAINFSISGGSNPYKDIVEQAFLSAYENGVFVAASAGNAGPTADTVAHRGPWVTTVAASTTDRHLLSPITLEADNGDTLELVGASVTAGINAPTPVVFSPDPQCNPQAPGTFNGEIVICDRGSFARVVKSSNVANAGAGGMILRNLVPQGLNTDNHFIPSVHLDAAEGTQLGNFMNAHSGVTATFTQGNAAAVPGDVMASFSSRGGPGQTLGISKPDITAPGVQILAGRTPLPATAVGGHPGELFQSIQGTSMSSPHIAGSGALLKALHPDWTPGHIKSALMMTAIGDVVKEDGVTPADPFDYGSGRVNLNKAGNPGLTISATAQDFIDHEDDLWNANYPSLYVPMMPDRITVHRTVRSELNNFSCWQTSVDQPLDIDVFVLPFICVGGDGDQSFSITVDARDVPLGEVRHATLKLKRNDETLRFSITIVRNEPDVTLDKKCGPLTLAEGDTTNCTISITNNSFEDANVKILNILPRHLRLNQSSVAGGTAHRWNAVGFEGIVGSADAPVIDVVPGSAPFGYVSLPSLGVGSITCSGSCDDVAFTFSMSGNGRGPVRYNEADWDLVSMASNGFVQLGGFTSATANNQNVPDVTEPNNLVAPLWTDLHPAGTDGNGGGNLYAAFLTDGVNEWLVLEWEAVYESGGNTPLYTFQTWLGVSGTQDIAFTYAQLDSTGTNGRAAVGAENNDSTIGDAYYFDGNGTFPTVGQDLLVTSAPGTPGETHIITYTAEGRQAGEWTNCVEMTADIFFGTYIRCINGEVTP